MTDGNALEEVSAVLLPAEYRLMANPGNPQSQATGGLPPHQASIPCQKCLNFLKNLQLLMKTQTLSISPAP